MNENTIDVSIGEALNSGRHPGWCSPAACTAYGVAMDGYHRSTPIVVRTDDPVVALYIYRLADADGGAGEFIELAKLDLSGGGPWHLTEPVLGQGILVPQASAGVIWRAVAELAEPQPVRGVLANVM